MKKMMMKLMLLLALSFSAACSPGGKTSMPAPANMGAPEDEEGGISAGGGGTLPSNPIHNFQVVEIVGAAKRFLRLYLNYERQFHDKSHVGADKYIFGEKNLATQLEITDIEILENKPCLNKFGKPVDASIHASRPNTICISAFRIAPKLIEENANKEIVALLAHELSHFLGSSEKEAKELQSWVALRINNISFKEAKNLERTTWDFMHNLEQKILVKDEIEKAIQSKDLKTLNQHLNQLYRDLTDHSEDFEQQPFRFVDFEISNYLEVITTKLHLATWFVGSMDPQNNFGAGFKESYDKCFGEASELSVRELSDNCKSWLSDNIYPDYKIKKMSSLAYLKEELRDVYKFAYDLTSRVRAIAFDQPLPYFELPTNKMPNAWEKFMGRYEVVTADCKSSNPKDSLSEKNLKGFEIYKEAVNYPLVGEEIYLKQVSQDGWSSDPNYNGAVVNSGTVKIDGTEDSAMSVAQRGSRWYDRQGHGWSRSIKKMQKLEADEYQLTISREYFGYDWRGVREASSSCQFTLKKSN